MNGHSGAACWICLEGGPDEKGKPIVRDCACRGNDAGFAHTSCIIKYATKKSREAEDSDGFVSSWGTCPICKQSYQNDLALHLSVAFVVHAMKLYGHPGNSLSDKIKVMDALRLQIQAQRRVGAMKRGAESAIHAVENLINKLLAMVDHAMEEHNMEGWLHMPPNSVEFQRYSYMVLNFQANSYYCLGQLFSAGMSEESINIEIGYYKKARDVYQSVGCDSESQLMNDSIKSARARLKGDEEGDCRNLKKIYESRLGLLGESAVQTISSGTDYVYSLRDVGCSIEAERLSMKLVAISRRVYGEEHRLTKESVKLLHECKKRHVLLAFSRSDGVFQALRYEDDGKICIVTGPIADSSQDVYENGQVRRIESAMILPKLGCPVICHGLINASHLNGKLGDVRSVSVDRSSGGFRLGVYFEDKSLNPAAVKPENLHIAIELPSV